MISIANSMASTQLREGNKFGKSDESDVKVRSTQENGDRWEEGARKNNATEKAWDKHKPKKFQNEDPLALTTSGNIRRDVAGIKN